MVERIYGGKVPLSSYETDTLHSRYSSDRRLSAQSSHLKTISETGDESSFAYDAGAAQQNDDNVTLNDGPLVRRRPRTLSLPSIYRDGSYLRIKRPSRPCKQLGRRFSEPGTSCAHQSLFAFAMSTPCGTSRSTTCDDQNSPLKEWSEAPLQSSLQQSATPRRHSDPMVFVTDNLNKLHVSEKTTVEKSDAKQELSCDSLKPQLPNRKANDQLSRPTAVTRRRKSSLVPVPFKLVQSQQKGGQIQLSRRPFSFPPLKTDSDAYRNLRQPLKGKPMLFNKSATVTKDSQNNSECSSFNPYFEGDLQTLLETTESFQSEKYANEDILTQWMNFFG